MKTEILKEKLEKVTEYLDFVLTGWRLDNLVVRLNDSIDNDWETPEELKVEEFHFEATFYDKEYSFSLFAKDIEADEIDHHHTEGDSELFDSFQSKIETEEFWEVAKLLCAKYEELQRKEYSE